MNTENNVPESTNDNNVKIEEINDDTLGNSVQSSEDKGYDFDMERYNQAVVASEPSFTLEPDQGLTQDPDELNSEDEKQANNVKK